MAGLLAAAVGVLFAGGTWLVLRARLFPVTVGLTLLSYGANLLLVASGGATLAAASLAGRGSAAPADPLPQALVPTAIAIGFATTALVVAIAVRLYVVERAEHVDGAPGEARERSAAARVEASTGRPEHPR